MSDHKRCAGCLRICEITLDPLTDGLCGYCILEGIVRIFPAKADTKPYRVDYLLHSGRSRSVEVLAIDAVDAKHLAEAAEGEVIVTAYARQI